MEKSNVKQRVINLKVYDSVKSFDGHVILFKKDNAAPQDIMAALSLFECDGLRVVIDLDTIDISAGSSEHNIK